MQQSDGVRALVVEDDADKGQGRFGHGGFAVAFAVSVCVATLSISKANYLRHVIPRRADGVMLVFPRSPSIAHLSTSHYHD